MLENLMAWPDGWEALGNLRWFIPALVAVFLVGVLIWLLSGKKEARRTTDNPEMLQVLAPSVFGKFVRFMPWLLLVLMFGVMISPLVLEPVRTGQEPFEQASLIASFDTSPSAGAYEPGSDKTVLEQEVDAFRDFEATAPETLQIGVISFDENVIVRLPPTTDRVALAAALDEIESYEVPDVGVTALGEAMQVSLDVADRVPLSASGERPVRIVILSDGADTSTGVKPEDVWNQPLAREIGINTVAFGSGEARYRLPDGSLSKTTVEIDPETLRKTAEATDADFRVIGDSAGLSNFYQEIGSSIGYRETTESADEPFTVIAAVIAILAGASFALTRTKVHVASRPIRAEEQFSEESIENRLMAASAQL